MVISGPRDKRDYSWTEVESEQTLQQMEEPMLTSQFISQSKTHNTNKEFQVQDYLQDRVYKDRMNKDKSYRELNRYSDICVYNDTRIILNKRPPNLESEQNTYINAAYVDSPLNVGDKQIIAAQGPLPNTIGCFWRMVAQEDVRMIVTVCRLKEWGVTKCEKYWPTDSTFDSKLSASGIDGMTVKIKSETQLTSHLIRREFTLNDEFTQRKEMPIIQLHYEGWPDHGAPSGETLDSFRKLLEEYLVYLLSSHDHRSIVHCSAGVGRTGTTIALAQIITQIWSQKNQGIEDPQLSIFSTVRRLRWSKPTLVQALPQYKFLYEFMAWYLRYADFI